MIDIGTAVPDGTDTYRDNDPQSGGSNGTVYDLGIGLTAAGKGVVFSVPSGAELDMTIN